MSLKKRIQSIIVISLLSVLVVGGYYLVSYFLGIDNTTKFTYSDSEIELIKDAGEFNIYMFEPQYMFLNTAKDKENNENKGEFSLLFASGAGEKLGSSIRDYFANKNLAKDTGERADEYESTINGFLSSLSIESSKIDYFYDENGSLAEKFNIEGNYIVFEKGKEIKKIPYDDFFVTLETGEKYAFNKTFLVNVLGSFSGKEQLDTKSLYALKGYDTDGDTVSTISGNPFVFPGITDRYKVDYMKVKNANGEFSLIQDPKTKNFVFENATTLSYNAEAFSTLLMSGIYMLSGGKVENPAELSQYGLDNIDKATAVVDVLLTDKTLHRVIIGNPTLDGKGYYAKHYKKDHIYILPNNNAKNLLISANDLLETTLVNAVSSLEDVYSVDDIHVKFLKDNKELHVVLLDDDDDDGQQIYSIWKILAPEELIPAGKEFGNPNSSAFTEFIQSAATLKTEYIKEYKMEEIPLNENILSVVKEDALENYKAETILSFSDDVLKKYGLDNPRLEVMYTNPLKTSGDQKYNITSRVIISDKSEDGFYYAYSYLYKYDSKGKLLEVFCTGCISVLTVETVEWLEWELMDFNNRFLYKNFVYNLDWIEVDYRNEVYRFNVDGSREDEDVKGVKLICPDGTTKDIDIQTFKFLYAAIINIYMVDNYDIADENPSEICKIKLHAGGGLTEMVFFRVTNTKAYYTLNGEGKYYVKFESVHNFLEKYLRVLDGDLLTKDD